MGLEVLAAPHVWWKDENSATPWNVVAIDLAKPRQPNRYVPLGRDLSLTDDLVDMASMTVSVVVRSASQVLLSRLHRRWGRCAAPIPRVA